MRSPGEARDDVGRRLGRTTPLGTERAPRTRWRRRRSGRARGRQAEAAGALAAGADVLGLLAAGVAAPFDDEPDEPDELLDDDVPAGIEAVLPDARESVR